MFLERLQILSDKFSFLVSINFNTEANLTLSSPNLAPHEKPQLALTKIVAKSERFSKDYSWLLRHSFFDRNDRLAGSEFAPEEYSVFYSHKPDKLKLG